MTVSRKAELGTGNRRQLSLSPARAAAFEILLRVEQTQSYASELLHAARYADLAPLDHGLATELVMGVLRWRSRLDGAIRVLCSQPLEKLDTEVLTALRLAAYQLGWLDRIPARAAIHESVELVKRARKRSAAPLANAVLRKLAESDRLHHESPDPIASACHAQGLAEASAHPPWLVERWVAKFGFGVAQRICAQDQAVPASLIRMRNTTAGELRREGIELAAGAFLAGAWRVVSGDITRTQAFAEGRLAIQDEGSQLVAALVGRGARILDCCAAPGNKTWAIADRNPEGTIVAVELHPHRASLVRTRVSAKNLRVITGDVRAFGASQPFDRVLVDAPCSGTGTLARHPEIKWRLRPADLADLQSRQQSILEAAMRQVAPGGRLIYSTCSLEQEESEAAVEATCASHPSFRVREGRAELEQLRIDGELVAADVDALLSGPYIRTIPGVHPSDGFFVAILERLF
jgi:16S rRNA (cytosine967-C5)-methyltransferase